MKLKDLNLKPGDCFKYSNNNGIWFVESKADRGYIVRHQGKLDLNNGNPYWLIIPGSHKHLAEWDREVDIL